jgi:hypothetical protein
MRKVPMFYHRRESKLSIFIKHSLFWSGLIFMLVISFVIIKKDDIKIPQKNIVIKLDIKDKINICLPDEKNK